MLLCNLIELRTFEKIEKVVILIFTDKRLQH